MTAAARWRGRVLALVGIVLFAFSLRSAVASLSPLLVLIQQELVVEPWVVGLIGTAPPVCFAVSGLFVPALERRLGLNALAVIALVVVGVSLAGRAMAPDAITLLLATSAVFLGVGAGNVVLPALVKASFPDRIGLVTSLYTTTMAASTFLPPLVVVPLAEVTSWRASLGLWAVFALAGAIPWALMLRRHRIAARSAEPLAAPAAAAGRVSRSSLAWALVVTFAASAGLSYTMFAWLPTIIVELTGASAAEAGAYLALFGVMGLPLSIVVPLVVVRTGAVGTLVGVAVASALAGLGGLIFAPAAATWLWVLLVATGTLLFPLVLVLVGLRTRTHSVTVALSGFVQSAGYAIAAAVPFAIGIVHENSGEWTVSLVLLAALMLCAIPAAFVVARPASVEDAWERRDERVGDGSGGGHADV